MRQTRYHSFLRVSAATTALVLVFASGLFTPVTKELSRSTIQYLAGAVGMSASVLPNDINTTTAALTAKEQQLNQREASLNAREIAARNFTSGTSSSDYMTYILAAILFLLTCLIVLNYVLDFIRARRSEHAGQAA